VKTLVVFQGGGPLGAFGCGAWQAVAAWLRQAGHELVGVAGASIGALNAAVVACHADSDDLGAAALARLWRDRIAQPLPAPPGAMLAE
jgi:NTE family protein